MIEFFKRMFARRAEREAFQRADEAEAKCKEEARKNATSDKQAAISRLRERSESARLLAPNDWNDGDRIDLGRGHSFSPSSRSDATDSMLSQGSSWSPPADCGRAPDTSSSSSSDTSPSSSCSSGE